jgi:hypothetical protein
MTMTGTIPPLLLIMTIMALPSPAAALDDAMKVKPRQEGLKVFEEKCLVCHNRQRIDAAVKERKDVERVMRQMEKQGAVLTEKDRQVIGHFWQQKLYKGESNGARPKP